MMMFCPKALWTQSYMFIDCLISNTETCLPRKKLALQKQGRWLYMALVHLWLAEGSTCWCLIVFLQRMNDQELHLIIKLLSVGLVDADPNTLHHIKEYRDLRGSSTWERKRHPDNYKKLPSSSLTLTEKTWEQCFSFTLVQGNVWHGKKCCPPRP